MRITRRIFAGLFGVLGSLALAAPALAGARLEAARKKALSSGTANTVQRVVVDIGKRGEKIERTFTLLPHIRGKHISTKITYKNGAERRIDSDGARYTLKVDFGKGSRLITSANQKRDPKTRRFTKSKKSYYISRSAVSGNAKLKPGEFAYDKDLVRRLEVE